MIFLKRRALMTRFSFNYKTASGVESLVLEKCAETFFKQFKLLGNSAQQETPSQEFPQEIKSVGEYNSDTGKYDVDVKITGKNLFDKDGAKLNFEFSYVGNDTETPKDGWFVSGFIPVQGGKTYCISGKQSGQGCKMYDKDKNFIKNLQVPWGGIIIEDNISYFRINGEMKDLDKIQVEEGDVITDYEPYKEPQTIKLSLDQPLRGIGEHKDEVTKDGIVRRIKQIVWNGTENWSLSNAILVNTNKFYLPKVDDAYSAYRKISSLVDALPFVADENSDELGQRFYLGNPMINLDKQKFPDVGTLKNWLSENPMTVQYALAEPIIEPLAEESKKALESLYTNEGTTVIAVDGGEVEAGIEVEYAVKE